MPFLLLIIIMSIIILSWKEVKWKFHPVGAFIKTVYSYIQYSQAGRGQDGQRPYQEA
jgi:hypothetical protein